MTALTRAADTLTGLSGWRRHGAAALFGVLAALAMPPVDMVPVLWLALPALALFIDSARRPRGAFAAGWWWGFGHFSAGFYWIGHAMLIDPWKFGWMIPFAVFGLGAGMALFTGLAAYVARRLAPAGPARILMLAAAWVFLEWVRSWFLTGFPWNLLGSVWIAALPVAQFASVVSIYGLSLITLLAAAMPAVLFTAGVKGARRAVILPHLLLAAIALWGWQRIPAEPQPVWPNVSLRLVQANVSQADKWTPGMRWMHLMQHIELSTALGFDKTTAVIWPETAAPVFIDHDQNARDMLTQAVPPHGLLLTGAPRAEIIDGEIVHLWNSLQALNGVGQILGSYDKAHLVPFGEYVPLSTVLPMPKITAGSIDFSPGPGPRTLNLPGLPPVSPIICYEAIFPGAVADETNRPAWMLNITNDGWFGLSAGPYQHFAASRLRAIEEGLPLARAANTGITAVVDPFGRVTTQLSLGEKGIVDGNLPKPLPHPTFFALYGNMMVFLPLFVIVVLSVACRRLSRN
ncbi:MAG TPA: apolipoprotein N-acyltransferase [Candidatus Sulfotelmatobacter sp.]|nr:apolipoprotein N-acyltransferase [Candidatus Sulfotelmatobacter sp.]